jgi:SAM-dependent methyltransferase
MSDPYLLEYEGFCPICNHKVLFKAENPWLRGHLKCQNCHSLPRERALALVLEEMHPHWRNLVIHESSPIERGISEKIRREGRKVMRSQFYPDLRPGAARDGFRNEDLQNLTLDTGTFDLFVSLDVFEHIAEPTVAFAEVCRTLRVGGAMICTWPVRKTHATAMEYRAKQRPDGSFEHIKPPEYHGNPVDQAQGSLVTVDYGYDIHQLIAESAPFDVRVYRFADRTYGLLGEFLDVFHCRKRPVESVVRLKRRADNSA